MTSTKSFLLLLLILLGLGGAIAYETITSVEHIKKQILELNNIKRRK
jgi:hypothetical protein